MYGYLRKNDYLCIVILKTMKKFFNQGELFIEDFNQLRNLPKDDEIIRLADTLPWDKLELIYNKSLKNDKCGANNIPAREVIGALIVKHLSNLSDRNTLKDIKRNSFYQYLIGRHEFICKEPFHHSLFSTIRKRIGNDEFNEINKEIMRVVNDVKVKLRKNSEEEFRKIFKDSAAEEITIDSKGRLHKGDAKFDATCCISESPFPTDWGLLYQASNSICKFLHEICTTLMLPFPATNTQDTYRVYMNLTKTKKKTDKKIRESLSVMLKNLKEDLDTFMNLIAHYGSELLDFLNSREKNIMRTIFTMYNQQEYMYKNNTRTCKDRILSIYQGFIRMIARGKAGAMYERGAKVGASITDEGWAFVDHISWNPYNESQDLKTQIELYQKRLGYLPKSVFADRIYMTEANCKLMKELEIEIMGEPLGRKARNAPKDPDHEAKMRIANGKRNPIEGLFGTVKRAYGGNNIKAKKEDTSESWIASCFFAFNISKFMKIMLKIPQQIVNEVLLKKNLLQTTDS